MINYNLMNTDYQLLFPENLKKYKNLKSLSLEIEKHFKKNYISKIENLAIFKNLHLQNNKILSILANQFSIDNWEENLDRQVKINLIKNAYWAHSKKGTKKAVVDSLQNLGYPIKLEEWFQFSGAPFTYRLTLYGNNFNEEWLSSLLNLIAKYKNCRSILETANIELTEKSKQYSLYNYRTIELEKEFTGIHNDIEKNKNINLGLFRVIEKEVSNV